jgi:hypothetical protein
LRVFARNHLTVSRWEGMKPSPSGETFRVRRALPWPSEPTLPSRHAC